VCSQCVPRLRPCRSFQVNTGQPAVELLEILPVEYASDTAFIAHLYPYDHAERNVTAWLYRLKKGLYRITLAGEGKDEVKGIIVQKQMELRRFSRVTIPLRPGREAVLKIEMLKEMSHAGPLPDLTIDEPVRIDGRIRVEVLNLGAGNAGPFQIRLEDTSGRTLAEQTVPGPAPAADFVPATGIVEFSAVRTTDCDLRVAVDPACRIDEITKENNAVSLP
jgi:hypothetical protein